MASGHVVLNQLREQREVANRVHSARLRELFAVALAKGVQRIDADVYEFEDPGFSLVGQRGFFRSEDRTLIYWQDWYEKHQWATLSVEPKKRRLHIPIAASFGKSLEEMGASLPAPDERVITMFLLMYALAPTGERLLPTSYVYGGEGHRSSIGNFGTLGLLIKENWKRVPRLEVGFAVELPM